MYTLVKDLEYFQIMFFWLNRQSERISPYLPSMQHAKEWIHEYHFGLYGGPERRRSTIDRRRPDDVALNLNRNLLKHGRRITDRPIRVDIDNASEKIEGIIAKKSTASRQV
jgi:hypothetical protein